MEASMVNRHNIYAIMAEMALGTPDVSHSRMVNSVERFQKFYKASGDNELIRRMLIALCQLSEDLEQELKE